MINFSIYRIQKLEECLPDLFSPTRRDVHIIIFSGPAGLTHHIDYRPFKLPPYSVLFIGPNRISQFDREMTADTYVLLFTSVFFGRSSRDLHFLQNTPLFNDHGQLYYMTLPEEALMYGKVTVYLLYQARNGIENQLNKDLAHNLIEQILIMGTINVTQVSNANYKDDLDNMLVVKYKKLIGEHFLTERLVKFYAEVLNVSERRLNKAVETVIGVGAKDVIIERVMDESKRQLLYSEKSIKEISLTLGFSGEQNFSAFFTKYAGIRPTEFRKKNAL